jgi:pyridoxine 5-phosphate synthase
MVKLSVNVNKVATLRNSRGGRVPSVTAAVRACLEAGAPGITVHPRADERHIRVQDVRDVAALLGGRDRQVEFNIEGDPRPGFVSLVRDVHPDQCTLVPVMPGEITSQAGWPSTTPTGELQGVIEALRGDGIRVSLFVEPLDDAIAWAHRLGADRVELYTEPYARAYERGGADRERSLAVYVEAARRAHALGLGVNAGHDLDLDNLPLFATVPYLAEVSIGHALISHALFVGLSRAVRDYLAALAPAEVPSDRP